MKGYILFLVFGLIFNFVGCAIYGYITDVFSVWYALAGTFFNFVIIFGLDCLISFIIHKLPEKYFNPSKKIYHVSKKERKLLEKLGVRHWKDLVPDMGQLCNFKKGKVESKDLNYLHKFLVEMNYAEVIHISMILIGFLDIVIWPLKDFWYFQFWLIIINTCLNIPPILIQRYNRPRMYDLYCFKMRKKAKIS